MESSSNYRRLSKLEELAGLKQNKVCFPKLPRLRLTVFLLDRKPRDYVRKNIPNEPEIFCARLCLKAWDSVREAKLARVNTRTRYQNIST